MWTLNYLRVLFPMRLLIPVIEPNRLALHSFVFQNEFVVPVAPAVVESDRFAVPVVVGSALFQVVFVVPIVVLEPLAVTVVAGLVYVAR